ncbi:MAG: SufD family Fe-S cluster assembly protein, partial [Steroidobacteraceae bacterium]
MSAAAQATAHDQPLERALRDFETVAARLPDAVVPQATRRRAAEQLAHLGWPTARDEQWRYANLRALERIATFAPSELRRAGLPAVPTPRELGLELPAALPGFRRLIFVDGVRYAGADAHTPVPTPLVDGSRAEADWAPEQRLGLLGDMFAQDGAVLQIEGTDTVELLFVTGAHAAGAVYPRLHLQLAPGSSLTLVERHLGAPSAPTLVCANVTVDLERGAQLQHYRLQQYGPNTVFYDSLSARVQQDAGYRVRQIVVGADCTRTGAEVRLAGRGASVNWQAIAVGRAGQVHDTTLKVVHAAPGTCTQEVFRGIAEERARLAFSGHVLI